MLLDFKKAYDSIKHDFIRDQLTHCGFPPWVTKAVTGLLTGVRARLTLNGSDFCFIDILRGVKQGCPLSPLIFNICLDMLLFALLGVPHSTTKAYADDLAVFLEFPGGFRIVIAVSKNILRASGLTVNTKKTVVIPTREGDDSIKTLIDDSIWNGVKLAEEATYLGVRIGHNLIVKDIYAKAFTKFEKRMGKLMAYRSTTSRTKRILYFNSLALPIFSYLNRFYVMPPSMLNEIDRWIGKYVTGKNNFEVWDLQRPTKLIGLLNPLVDPAGRNHSQLSKNHKEVPEKPPPRQELLSVEQQRANSFHWAASYSEEVTINCSAKKIYQAMMESNYWANHHEERLFEKYERFGIGPQGVGKALLNYARLPKLTDHVRMRFIDTLHNACSTGRRLRWTNSEFLNSSTPCFFCGHTEQKGGDSSEHLFLDCHMVDEALLLSATNYDIQFQDKDFELFLLAKDLNRRQAVFVMAFVCSVWDFRLKTILNGNHAKPTAKALSATVTDTLHRIKKGLSPLENPLLIPGTATHKKALQKWSNLSKTKEEAKAKVEQLLTDFSGKTVVFTDGSANPNPGPSGAGIYFTNFPIPGVNQSIAACCGYGTNNTAEMKALAIAITALSKQDTGESLILTDSVLALNIAKGNFRSKKNPSLGLCLFRLFQGLRKQSNVRLEWVPGHVQIEGNETADRLASQGAKKQNSADPPDLISYLHFWADNAR